MSNKTIKLKENEDFITLNILLKIAGIIQTGGMAKIYLQTNEVKVNGELENRRGRKLRHGDVVKCANEEFVID